MLLAFDKNDTSDESYFNQSIDQFYWRKGKKPLTSSQKLTQITIL